MPKVLRIINRLNLGGPTYNVSFLSKYLAPEFDTMLLSGIKMEEEGSSEFILNEMGLRPIYIDAMHREINLKNDYLAYKNIKQIIREFKPDIVHTHAAKSGTLGRLAAIHSKVPVILHTFHGHVFHSYFSPVKTRMFLEIERFLARRTSGIIAISEIQKEELCNTFKVCHPDKTFVVPLGFNLSKFQDNMPLKRDHFRKQYHLANDEIAIGIIGRITAIKNIAMFIKAYEIVKNQTPKKVKAFIIGDGEDKEEMISFCASLNLKTSTVSNPDDHVIFTSWIKDIDQAIAGLDIVAMTSLNEGTPVSLIEAQAGNKPIVSTRVGGIENVVLENKTALLSASEDIGAFAANLLKLVNDGALRFSFSAEGWDHVKDRFHFSALVENMRKLYHSLLK